VGAVNTIYTLKLAKLYAPNATVLVGGYHATFFHERWVLLGADIVIRHEAEVSFKTICEKIQNKSHINKSDLLGCTYANEWFERINSSRSNSEKIPKSYIQPKEWKNVFKLPHIYDQRLYEVMENRPFAKTLDEFPLPLRTKLDYTKNYLPIKGDGYMTTLETGRGCPYNCEFCSTVRMWGCQQRYKSVPILIKEIKQCLKLGIKKIYMIDESWGVNVPRDMEFLAEIKKQKLEFQWGIQIRPDTIIRNPELLKLAGECGCRMALVGFESLDQNMLNFCSKGTHANQFATVKRILRDANILSFGYFLIGLPGETEASRKRTIRGTETIADLAFVQQYIKYFDGAFQNSEKKAHFPFFMKNKIPVFFVDTEHVNKTASNKEELKNTNATMKEVRNYLIRFFLNPQNLWTILTAHSTIDINKKEFLLSFYKIIFSNLLRFNPNHLLYWLRGE
jgi:radical SAM superfamily enzyme YgiQ (UPF0313 family)